MSKQAFGYRAGYYFVNFPANLSTEATRYKYIVAQGYWNDASSSHYYGGAGLSAAYKALDPTIKVFLYTDVIWLDMTANQYGFESRTATTLASSDAAILGESCFLHSATPHSSGNRIVSPGTPTWWAMNFGDAATQARAISTVVAKAVRLGFDGVFLDEPLAFMQTYFPSLCDEYGSEQALFDACYDYIEAFAAAAVAAGLLVAMNVTVPENNETTLQRALAYMSLPGVTAALAEGWTMTSQAHSGSPDVSWENGRWARQMRQAALMHSLGRELWCEVPADSSMGALYDSRVRFGFAMAKVCGGDAALVGIDGNPQHRDETYYTPDEDDLVTLGSPTSGLFRLPGRTATFKRYFEGGVVVVNASSVTTETNVSLGGGSYTGSGQTSVAMVTMAPQTGVIMLGTPSISFVQQFSNTATGAGTTLAITAPTGGIDAGETLLLWAGCGTLGVAQTLPTITDSKGNYWMVEGFRASANGSLMARCDVTKYIAAGDTITITWSGSSTVRAATILQFAGVAHGPSPAANTTSTAGYRVEHCGPRDQWAQLEPGSVTTVFRAIPGTPFETGELAIGGFITSNFTIQAFTAGTGLTAATEVSANDGAAIARRINVVYKITTNQVANDSTVRGTYASAQNPEVFVAYYTKNRAAAMVATGSVDEVEGAGAERPWRSRAVAV